MGVDVTSEQIPLKFDPSEWAKLDDAQRADVWASLERGYAHAKLDVELAQPMDQLKYKWLSELQREAGEARRYFSERVRESCKD